MVHSQYQNDLKKIKERLEFKKSIFENIKQVQRTELSNKKNVTIEITPSANLPKKIVNSMRYVVVNNFSNYTEAFQEMIQNTFQSKTKDPDTELTIAYFHKGRKTYPMAFFSMTKLNDERYEFGTFNVNSDLFGGAEVGRALFEERIKDYMNKQINIIANCDPNKLISQTYIESGFVATGITDIVGVPSFSIIFDPNETYETKNWSIEELKQQLNTDSQSENIIIRQIIKSDLFSELNNGYVLTRFLTDAKNAKIGVFEKIKITNQQT